MINKVLYRYEARPEGSIYGISNIKVHLRTYIIWKHTPQGRWIVPIGLSNCSDEFKKSLAKWISNNSKFAWETKELALKSFIIRQRRNVFYNEQRMLNAKQALGKARMLQLKIENENTENENINVEK